MRISDWSSDVFFRSPRRRCRRPAARTTADRGPAALGIGAPHPYFGIPAPSTAKDAVMTRDTALFAGGCFWCPDRKRVVKGKGVSVRVDRRGRRIIKKNTHYNNPDSHLIECTTH